MQDFIYLVTLVCAAIASMGLGVLTAFAIFRAGFALMRWHTELNPPVKIHAATQTAPVS